MCAQKDMIFKCKNWTEQQIYSEEEKKKQRQRITVIIHFVHKLKKYSELVAWVLGDECVLWVRDTH